MSTKLRDGQSILFIGDSITDCDRTSNAWRPLGFGYVGLFADMLAVREPAKKMEVVNTGINGNTLGHLLSRWCDDVLDYKPDVISILIGINDATRYLDASPSLHLPPEEFRVTYNQILEETRKRLPGCRILLIEPFFLSRGDNIEGSYRNKLIKVLEKYIGTVRDMAASHDAILVPLSSIFADLMRYKIPSTYSEDRIHLNRTGHMVVAEAVYKALTIGEGEEVCST